MGSNLTVHESRGTTQVTILGDIGELYGNKQHKVLVCTAHNTAALTANSIVTLTVDSGLALCSMCNTTVLP